MQKITCISQDQRNNLILRYFEKDEKGFREIPRYGIDRRTDDVYIARLVNDIARRKDKIKFINDTFRDHTRYKQITIDGKTIVLKNPAALLKRADFANLAESLRDRKNEIRLKEGKLKRTAIAAVAIGSAIAAVVISASAIGVSAFQASTTDEEKTTETDQLMQEQDNKSLEETISEKSSILEENTPQYLQDKSGEQLISQPNPIVIPDNALVDYNTTYDLLSPERTITMIFPKSDDMGLSSNDMNEVDNLQLLSNTYGMTKDQIMQICNSYNLDVSTSDFSSLQNAISSVYWKNPEQFMPTAISPTQKDIEQEIYKVAMAYGFTNDEEIATLIAIARLETGYYTSEKFCNLNNLGGVHINSEFIKYNTISQGAFGLVKTVSNLKNNMIQEKIYDSTQTLATNIGPQYCPNDQAEVPWAPEVDKIKNKILSSGELMEIKNQQSQVTETQQGVTR